ncbi:citrate lyase subunit beta [Pyronema omphalodes]|nr:citrate lyase subunit beta [Pyronema omphalodes]
MATASLAKSVLRRALLYVPGSNARMLQKSRGLDVDCIAYDLEDSVTQSQKPLARQQIRDILSQPRAAGIREQAVRINAVDTGLAEEDLEVVLKGKHVDTIVVPKVNKPSDLTFITSILSHAGRPDIKLLALIESARAVMDIQSICASTKNLSGLIFAAEDFSLDLGITRTPSLMEFLFARQMIVTAAKAAELHSCIDLVCTDYLNPDGALTTESIAGSAMGFTGKQCIHPNQVPIVQQLFSPSPEKLRDAVRILVAEREAERLGKGSWSLDGKMIDRPVIERAKKIVELARGAGADVEGVWREVESVGVE